jgi:glucose/arabinose dehydrogenase
MIRFVAACLLFVVCMGMTRQIYADVIPVPKTVTPQQIAVATTQDAVPWASTERTTFTPAIHHPTIAEVTLLAEHPEIVTLMGIAVAPDGRVFVQENHTHKRNSDYEGPETDRILIFEDTDKDGIADKRSVFDEGHTFSTDLLFGPDGHLYVSTRWFVGRFLDAAAAQKADGEPQKLVICETSGDYPHNGVGVPQDQTQLPDGSAGCRLVHHRDSVADGLKGYVVIAIRSIQAPSSR